MERLVKCIRGIRGPQILFYGKFTAGKVYGVVMYDSSIDTKMHCLVIDDEGFEIWAEDDCFEAINFDMETGKIKGGI